MSDREYYDEETLQSYRESLINRRNNLSPITNQTYIKILNQMIDELPEHFGEESLEHKKLMEKYLQKESEKRELKNFLISAWPFVVPIILALLLGLFSLFN